MMAALAGILFICEKSSRRCIDAKPDQQIAPVGAYPSVACILHKEMHSSIFRFFQVNAKRWSQAEITDAKFRKMIAKMGAN
jgi:hypothetical protein